MAWLDKNPDLIHFPTDTIEQKEMAKELLAQLKGSKELVSTVIMVMNTHNKLYFSTGFKHNDAGGGNMSKDSNNQLVYHDLGPNRTSDYQPRKTLDQVHATRKKLKLPPLDEI
jgi:predicted unusual protein kinase regulating ubiquinone biosynthesis (AarF/ABC1/UbiB family)